MQINSVHLENFPNSFEEKINHDVIKNMNLIREIATIALRIRKKHNISVKVPLTKMIIYGDIKIANQEYVKFLEEEVNIIDIKCQNDSFDDVAKKEIKFNFAASGKKFGAMVPKIQKALTESAYEFNNNKLHIQSLNLTLEPTNFIVQYIPIDSNLEIESSSDNKIIVAIDIKITEQAKIEAMTRSIIRMIQNERKLMNLNLNARLSKIEIYSFEDDLLQNAIQLNKEKIASDVLLEEDQISYINDSTFSGTIKIKIFL
jgi:isoleucyl-tRNA synthetase